MSRFLKYFKKIEIMKKSFFHHPIPLVFIFLVLFSSTNGVQSQNNEYFTSNLRPNEKITLKESFLNKTIAIANTLIANAQPDNVSGLKWNKYYNLTSTAVASKYYFGYYYGAAGIGDYFTDLYNLTRNTTYLTEAIGAFDYINAHAIRYGPLYDSVFTKPGFVIWQKSEDDLIVYSGIKYGNAGISNFAFNLYLNTNNKTYLNLAQDSLNTLIYLAIKAKTFEPTANGLYWGYSPNKDKSLETPIADIIYGNAGIASSFLTAYQITTNVSYLNTATEAIQWILSQSSITDNSSSGQRFIRYSPDPTYHIAFTGYLTGASGVGNMLLTYYSITGNSDYLLYAQQIGNWLVSQEKNGFWPNGGVDLLTSDAVDVGTFTGFGAGSSGISMFLLHLFDVTNNNDYLAPIGDTVSMLKSKAVILDNNLAIPIKIDQNQQIIFETDLKMGLSGIGLFFTSLYHYFGLNESVLFLSGILNYLNNVTDYNGIIPNTIGTVYDPTLNYDLSMLEGLAGIGFLCLKAFKSLNSTTTFPADSFTNYRNNSNPLPGFEFLTIFSIGLMAIIWKKKNP